MDVVGSKRRPRHLLHQVVLFDRAAARADERQGIVSVALCAFDYLTFVRSPYNPRWKGERDRLLALEAYCRRKGLRFGLICNTEARQTGSDREFYEQTLQALQLYRAAGGQPDSFTVESWFEFPRQLLPETAPYTFTLLARDFAAQVRRLYPID